MNKHLNSLTDYPFQYLSELLQGVESESNDLIGLHIGEPKGNPPEEALDIIKNGAKFVPNITLLRCCIYKEKKNIILRCNHS